MEEKRKMYFKIIFWAAVIQIEQEFDQNPFEMLFKPDQNNMQYKTKSAKIKLDKKIGSW